MRLRDLLVDKGSKSIYLLLRLFRQNLWFAYVVLPKEAQSNTPTNTLLFQTPPPPCSKKETNKRHYYIMACVPRVLTSAESRTISGDFAGSATTAAQP